MSGRHSFSRWTLTAALAAVLVMALAAPGAAQHRARLAKDVADQLATPSRVSMKVIVESTMTTQDLAARHGLRVKKQLEGGVVLEGTPAQFDALANDADVAQISGDNEVKADASLLAQEVGADQVWNGFGGVSGVNGRGIVIAMIDSGIGAHKALNNRVLKAVDFTGTNTDDKFGHGTHLANLIAGRDLALDGLGQSYGGVAPGARLISLKVLNEDGSGDTSDVIAAIEWAIKYRDLKHIRIVTLALGHPVFESYKTDRVSLWPRNQSRHRRAWWSHLGSFVQP